MSNNFNTANLCKCNKCESILIDNNPQTGAKAYNVPDNAIEMVYIPEDKGAGFYACPVCLSDEYLTDL